MKRATLNHSYRLVWNKALGAFVAVAELARSQRKGGTAGATALLLSCLPLPALATLPTGGTVEAGTGSISQNGNAMTINQGSDKLVFMGVEGAGQGYDYKQHAAQSGADTVLKIGDYAVTLVGVGVANLSDSAFVFA